MSDAVMADERWLPVVGYEGSYEVSDLGRVRSLDRYRPTDSGKRLYRRGRVLKPSTLTGGYRRVVLCVDGQKRDRTVHSLVAEAFIGPRPAGMDICHGPSGSQDNRAANLRYDTRNSNTLDQVREGKHRSSVKTHCTRQHPLVAPNLIAAFARKGQRNCLACARARAAVRGARLRHGIELDLQAESDHHFAVITRETEA